MSKKEEKKFYAILQDMFVGAEVEGQGGFINLMRIKSRYYEKIESLLKKDVDEALEKHPAFREELFDKLHSFFSRYFTQNGSICFNDTAFHNNVYEKVYTNEKDVVLFWKTHMLYYVKTDSLYRTMPVELDGLKFNFDASNLENKKTNEKKELVFVLKNVNDTINFEVMRSERGLKTKINEMLGAINKDISVTEEQLKRAFRLFGRQSEVDYFINKNAESFLKEQFKLWSYQYFWEGAPQWDAERINQLQILKEVAFKTIDFIAQFENELVKIWNKPKFVKNSNYVITLDRLNEALRKKIRKAKGYKRQVKEWKALGIEKGNSKAPIDTKHFKDLESEILGLFDNLDEALDGWLIKSENYQALNTILQKFRGRVQCIYIDPPFNTGSDFDYIDKFQDSTWLALMDDRFEISIKFLNSKGNYLLHLDKNANQLGKILIGSNHGLYISNEIIWDKGFRGTESKNIFQNSHDTIFFIKMSEDSTWNQPTQMYKDLNMGRYNQTDDNGDKYALVKRRRTDGTVYYGKTYPKEEGKSANDVISYVPTMASTNKQRWGDFQTQKPEELIQIFIEMSTDMKGIVLDFFGGSGTTMATAHKSGRKWIGIEAGDCFSDIILVRLKEVLSGHGNHEPCGISKKNWEGGGFFKYYELEQYEETLANCRYKDGNLFTQTSKSDYEQYVFLSDEKMLRAIEVNYKNKKVQVNLDKLYKNIDIAETLSNLTGKWIKTIEKNVVTFNDGDKINIADLDYKHIKQLIWWE